MEFSWAHISKIIGLIAKSNASNRKSNFNIINKTKIETVTSRFFNNYANELFRCTFNV